MKLKPIDQQVIVITGASSGIGLVTAREAARRGASVLLVARNEAALADAVDGITAEGGSAAYAVADVGILGEVEHAATTAIERFGRIDTWVNNAGVAIYAKLVDTPMDEHERLFRTNYFGVVHGAISALPHLREHGGALITVASIVADLPSPVMGAYAASKHAVEGYIESLRIEVAADRLPIAITLIKPSGIGTPIASHAAAHVDGAPLIPPPVYAPQLVADAILDAVEHPRRSVTVGGVGRLETLVAAHFPWLLDLMGGPLARALVDPTRDATPTDNLDGPAQGGEERSDRQPGRRISLYQSSSALAVIGAVALGGALLWRRRDQG